MKKKLLILIALLVVVGTAVYFVVRSHRDSDGPLVLYGNVDIREVELGFRVAGRVQAVFRDEGDPVIPGDIIAQLDPAPYERIVDQTRAGLAAAQARLDKLKAGFRSEEIAQARQTVEERQANLANARQLFERQRKLVASNVISSQVFEDSKFTTEQAQARLENARKNLDLLESGSRPEDIAAATAELDQAQARLASAQLDLADTTLRAPQPTPILASGELSSSPEPSARPAQPEVMGTVLTRVVEPGTIVQAGSTILTVSVMNPVYVRAYVDESQLGLVHPGLRVTLTNDTHPDRPYHATVGYVSPRAEFTPKSVETPDLRTSLVYRFRVVVDDADLGLRQGMPVTIQVPRDQPET